jgi:hypothetical protein
MKPILLAVLLTLPPAAQRKPGNQLDNLPSNMEVLTHFGERADISPDNPSAPATTPGGRGGRGGVPGPGPAVGGEVDESPIVAQHSIQVNGRCASGVKIVV